MNEAVDDNDLARMFRALGDPTRLKIFQFLRAQCCPVAVEETGDVRPVVAGDTGDTRPVVAGDTGDVRPVAGPTVGDVCCHVTGADRITSTISVHLKTLHEAGLITIQPQGKFRICGVNPEAVAKLSAYLADDAPAQSGDACCC